MSFFSKYFQFLIAKLGAVVRLHRLDLLSFCLLVELDHPLWDFIFAFQEIDIAPATIRDRHEISCSAIRSGPHGPA